MVSQVGTHVGIDVAKHRLDVSLGAERFWVSNDAAGQRRLVERLMGLSVSAIGLEASGGYERAARRALQEAGLPVRMVDSWRLRQFARACGRHAKTDPLDADMIARFVQTMPEVPQVEPDPAREQLADLVSYRDSLVDLKVRLVNQAAQLADNQLVAMTTARIQALKDDIALIDRRIRALVRSDSKLRHKLEILCSAPGVGFVVAVTLLARLPELGNCCPKKIAALVGVAPFDNQSGRSRQTAHIARGRPAPRARLYLAVLTQLRRCPWAQAFRDKLTASGKPKMVAVVALMRRLLVALNAMIKQNRPWFDPA